MAEPCCGIDFGTSNSSIALAEGDSVNVLPLDPSNDNPASLPSLLYISRDGEEIVGRSAANTFIERNVDREVLVRTVELGVHIEGYVGGELDNEYGGSVRKDGQEMAEVVTARALVEVNAPGRLFQSLKTSLRLREFRGTEVFGTQYQIEELVAVILKRIKAAADEAAGQAVESAVFGRPVRFSLRSEEDQTAQRRLETAARLAGFKDIQFFYEPVAACVDYAIAARERQRLMVVDIGGGTFDVCIMDFGGGANAAQRLSESKILGVSGVPVAGDAIDHEIIRSKIFPRVGSRARYGPSNLRLPQYVFNAIIDWQNMYRLNTEETINWLIAAEASSDQPERIHSLRTLIQRNYAYPLMREVEAAKRRLSDVVETTIDFERAGIALHERLERQEFSHIIEHMIDQMKDSMIECEQAAGVTPDSIDLVLTTGGTSLIPAVRAMLAERYGAEKLQQRETFTSVAAGLAAVARFA